MAPRFVKRGTKKIGASPGTLMHIGERLKEMVTISLMNYNADNVLEKTITDINEALPYIRSAEMTWLNVEGLHDPSIIEKIGSWFNIHSLTLEDILHTDQRPKVDEYEEYLYIVFNMLRLDDRNLIVTSEQVSLIISDHCLISFQEGVAGDVFDPIRERIQKGKGRIRVGGCDYLAYALLDAVVDHYFLIMERIGTQIDEFETQLMDSPRHETLKMIHELKREIIFLRKQIWPLRDVIGKFAKGESRWVRHESRLFIGDLHDHLVQIMDIVESFRDILSGMIDLYLSVTSHRLNEIMKILTMIATIFIPITFIAGVYGMNFKYMPELEWRWGYPAAWGLMAAVVWILLLYFKRNKWL